MTLEKMLGLLGTKNSYDQRQLIFPDIRFTCSGQVVKWIMGGTWNADRDNYPQLQVWRPSGDSMYHRQGGSSATADMMMDDGVYEFTADPPIPFQPGDVLGVFQPSSSISRLQVDYDDGENSMCYYAGIGSTDGMPVHTSIDTSGISLCPNTGVPLVTVVIGKLFLIVTVLTVLHMYLLHQGHQGLPVDKHRTQTPWELLQHHHTFYKHHQPLSCLYLGVLRQLDHRQMMGLPHLIH